MKLTQAQIAKFSKKDVSAYEKYEEQMERFIKPVVRLLETRPANLGSQGPSVGLSKKWKSMMPLLKACRDLKASEIPELHDIMTSSASRILDRWFESEPLKATLATDALIGVMAGPHSPGTGYVLLHHILGGVEGHPGEWVFAEGGMGGVSAAIGRSAASLGASIFTGQVYVQTALFKSFFYVPIFVNLGWICKLNFLRKLKRFYTKRMGVGVRKRQALSQKTVKRSQPISPSSPMQLQK